MIETHIIICDSVETTSAVLINDSDRYCVYCGEIIPANFQKGSCSYKCNCKGAQEETEQTQKFYELFSEAKSFQNKINESRKQRAEELKRTLEIKFLKEARDECDKRIQELLNSDKEL